MNLKKETFINHAWRLQQAPLRGRLLCLLALPMCALDPVKSATGHPHQIPSACVGSVVQAAEACKDASAQAPMVGRWSDALWQEALPAACSFLCGGAQVFALLTYLTLGTSLFWMFPAQASSGYKCNSDALSDIIIV